MICFNHHEWSKTGKPKNIRHNIINNRFTLMGAISNESLYLIVVFLKLLIRWLSITSLLTSCWFPIVSFWVCGCFLRNNVCSFRVFSGKIFNCPIYCILEHHVVFLSYYLIFSLRSFDDLPLRPSHVFSLISFYKYSAEIDWVILRWCW